MHIESYLYIYISGIVNIWKVSNSDGYECCDCGWTTNGGAYYSIVYPYYSGSCASVGVNGPCGIPPELYDAYCRREPGWFYLIFCSEFMTAFSALRWGAKKEHFVLS